MARSKRSTSKVRPGKSLAGKQARQLDDTNAMVESLPFNANKAAEYGRDHAIAPMQGQHAVPPSDLVGASSLAEANRSDKTGRPAAAGDDLAVGLLDRVRVDATGQPLTTNQGVPVADNQNSLKAGLRGPALLEDFILREKITHFDHERIPERIVHARGSAAHGYLRVLRAAHAATPRAAPFQPRPARSRRCSCAFPPWRASADPRTPRATCAVSP